jgi:hypothetical protein
MCNSSWAIAMANSMSDNVCISKGHDYDLSAQQILDCVDASYASCSGFNNGSVNPVSDALKFVSATGLTDLSCYPYTSIFSGQTDSKCYTFCNNGSRMQVMYKVSASTPLTAPAGLQNFLMNSGSVYFSFSCNYWDFFSLY